MEEEEAWWQWEMEQQQQLAQQQQAAQEKQQQMAQQFKAEEAEKDRAARITEAQIRSAGYGSMVDINKNEQSDYMDALKHIEGQKNYQETMNFKREQEVNKSMQATEKHSIEREKLQAQKEIADKQLQIARENKNKYDVGKSSKEKKK